MTIISTTTALSNVAQIGELGLLRQLFGTLAMPTEVYAEIQQAQAEGYAFFDRIEAQITPFVPDGWLELVTMGE